MKTKSILLLLAMLMLSQPSYAQSADNEDEVVKIDKWNQHAYREGEILVKFRSGSTVQMRASQKKQFQTTRVNAIDALFAEIGVDSVEQLMPRTGHKNVGKKLRAYNGSIVEVKDLSKLYRVTLRAGKAQGLHQAIERLQAMDEVEFAEPNYLVYTLAIPYDTVIPTQDSATYVSEPLYSQQWGPAAINLPSLWNKPKTSSKRPVIAIIDSGVDIEHPDLAANIWTNSIEANGIAGIDDDGNGFIDDVHGWDFINQTGVLNDFNGHGTHCAGIAAAVGNNGIGISGANPDAYIMPVTVMQSNGTGDVATIIRGIDYASANGADVISMSIGSYTYSIAEEQALGRAYSNAVLVAAAGNDGYCIYPHLCKRNGHNYNGPVFPAAFSFVLGTEASSNASGCLASFSNFDEDGPSYTRFGESQLYNYELRAPGVNVLSAFPGGRYKVMNGTSMACPLAAGAISRLLQCKDPQSKELLFGDLIYTHQIGRWGSSCLNIDSNGNIDIISAYNITDADRHPILELLTYTLSDSINGDGDERADAGETLAIYPIFKNGWGQAENIRFWIKTGFDNDGDWVWDDTTMITHHQDTSYVRQTISSYAKAKSHEPWLMTLNSSCADNRSINLTFFATCDNTEDTLCQRISLEVENGEEIGGMIAQNTTLYPNKHYIVTSPLAVPDGITLTIKPGTVIRFKDGTGLSIVQAQTEDQTMYLNGDYRYVQTIPVPGTGGHIVAVGTPDSMIVFTKCEGEMGDYTLNFNQSFPGYFDENSFVVLDSLCPKPIEYVQFDYCVPQRLRVPFINGAYLKNCIISNYKGSLWANGNTYVEQCNIINNETWWYDVTNNLFQTIKISNSNIANNLFWPGEGDYAKPVDLSKVFSSNYFGSYFSNYMSLPERTKVCLLSEAGTPVIHMVNANYLGSTKESIIRKDVYDIQHGYNYGFFDLTNILTRPSAKAHGVVWKILIDGHDAQDEFDSIPPLGVGLHRCDVYFNRAMDTTVSPFVAYGVRMPYTQNQISKNAFWSSDSTIYTAFFTIDAKTVSDGINRIYVANAKDDEHFEVLLENSRFNMEIAAMGSMSTGLMAEAGLGSIKLTWRTDEADFEDLLGYNIYRWTTDTIKWNRHYDRDCRCYIEAGYRFDTICINASLIEAGDTAYTDYDVIPGKAYYYIIREMTTDFASYNLSNPVIATPLTAIKGDANGSMTVDVADIITEVNYITCQNPKPFIFEAADVNSDSVINVLDVVETINMILNPQTIASAIVNSTAYYYVQNGILYVETETVLGGVQVSLNGNSDEAITPLDALNEFEKVSMWQTEEDYFFMAYSMSGKTLGVGTHALLQIGDADITNIVFSDAQGHNVVAMPQVSTSLDGTKFMPNSRKYIEGYHLYIQMGNHIYSAEGQLIK